METKQTGYGQKPWKFPVKRYCQMLELKDSPELIRKYIEAHSESHFWPEIGEGIRAVGILEMEIYNLGNRLFMIVETAPDFEWNDAFFRLAGMPRQQEWEAFVAAFQQVGENARSEEKWQLMDRIFHL